MVAKKELVFLLPRRGKPSQIEKKLMEMFDSKEAEEEEKGTHNTDQFLLLLRSEWRPLIKAREPSPANWCQTIAYRHTHTNTRAHTSVPRAEQHIFY